MGTSCISGGHTILGGTLSLTVTVHWQVAVFPELSVAVALMLWVPMARTVPEGMLVCVTVAASLSAADTVKV